MRLQKRKESMREDKTIGAEESNAQTGESIDIEMTTEELFDGDQEGIIYSISENGYQEEENFIKAKEHLERILREE